MHIRREARTHRSSSRMSCIRLRTTSIVQKMNILKKMRMK